MSIAVVDVFAGPGGLGEGFASLRDARGAPVFDVVLSVENDDFAYRTLLLRSFYRQFPPGEAPDEYYAYLRGDTGDSEPVLEWLFSAHPREAVRARRRVWRATLGEVSAAELRDRIGEALGHGANRTTRRWVLIGGPPCQAYSIAGRARRLPAIGAKAFYADKRHTLYREYLRILADHAPSVFLMENVKGLLSLRLRNDPLFDRILADLARPKRGLRYDLYALAPQDDASPSVARLATAAARRDFVVQAERHGIPQARHRVMILGVLRNAVRRQPRVLRAAEACSTCRMAISGLPRIRSALSREPDSAKAWRAAIAASRHASWMPFLRANGHTDVAREIELAVERLTVPRRGTGGRFVPGSVSVGFHEWWFIDSRLDGACNHEGRSHMREDLHRYLYASCYARTRRKSPRLEDLPPGLLPRHRNVPRALTDRVFNDRFRVQLGDCPASTVTSHIAKDGHYYIHPDATQCRSLTVREAARLQTFPDNYFFEGPRTEQYRQVGNAVPPLLARQIAQVVAELLT